MYSMHICMYVYALKCFGANILMLFLKDDGGFKRYFLCLDDS